MAARKAVCVVWIDSCSPQRWTDHDSLEGYTPDEITSVGFVVVSGRKHMTIAAHVSASHADGIMCIPRSAIRSVKKVVL